MKVSNQRNFIDLSSMVIYFLFSPFWPTVKPVTPRSLVYGYLFPFFPFGQELNCRPPQWKLGIQPTRPPRNSKPVYFSTTIWRSPVKSLERGEVIDDQETNPTSHALNSKAYFHGWEVALTVTPTPPTWCNGLTGLSALLTMSLGTCWALYAPLL